MDPGAELMLRFQGGDDDAFGELFESHKAQVMALAFRYLNDKNMAEEVTQEAFLRVFQARERYKPSAAFSTWVYRITVNACLDVGRSKKRLVPMERGSASGAEREYADEKTPGPTESADREALSAAVASALQSLPETQRILVILTSYHDLSIVDAARAAGVSAVGGRLRLMRARKALKKSLAEFAE